ncbi:MAG: glycoside hydrolase family 68 protein [Actinomycetia bacterium]|nr:glycoside hydrolase family 68 protein [Actinomycetes bacterium]
MSPSIERLLDAPIVGPDSHPTMGSNIQGPSVLSVPEWIEEPLGRLYLYFADHKGTYIRLAFADQVAGPWVVHAPGALQLVDSGFPTEPFEVSDEEVDAIRSRYEDVLGFDRMPSDLRGDLTIPHVASPDVHVDEAAGEVVCYFHGLAELGRQASKVAVSTDGITFSVLPGEVPHTYLRAFLHDGATYGLAMPGVVYRSTDGRTGWEQGPTLFGRDMRHSAVTVRDGTLHVFWTRVGDAPESILHSTVDLDGDWGRWRASKPAEVLRPERPWEGADLPVEPSIRGAAEGPVRQLRDPALFEDGGRTFLFYAVAGESGIGVAEITW